MQNILETQVSDLSSLVDSPIPISVSNTPLPFPSGNRGMSAGPRGSARGAGSVDGGIRGEMGGRPPHERQDSRYEVPSQGGESRGSVGGSGTTGAGGSGKRKSDDANGSGGGGNTSSGGGTGQNGQQQGQPRAKRNRYISIACNECKRRKIKCNGQTPCQRCGNLNLACQYAPNCCASSFKDSPEYSNLTTHLASLQNQVDSLYASMRALQTQQAQIAAQAHTPTMQGSERSGMARLGSIVSERPSQGSMASPSLQFRGSGRGEKSTPKFAGPTSSKFSFDVAKNTLHNMGYIEDGPQDAQDETPMHSPPQARAGLYRDVGRDGSRDPLGMVGMEEAERLIGVFEEEIWVMYPFLDMDVVAGVCRAWYSNVESEARQDPRLQNGQHGQQNGGGMEDIPEHDLNILKLVMAIATMVEGSGRSSFGERLFDTVKTFTDSVLHRENIGLKDIALVALVATYHFHVDEEALAWRTVTLASRLCIELGLHRCDSLFKNFPDPSVRGTALRLFWSIYCLDRRWSFGTGMPFAMQDADIDPSLPEPEVRGGLPYLGCMIEYSRIGGRVWRSVAGLNEEDGAPVRGEEVGYLDYKVTAWQKSIPDVLQLPPPGSPITSNRAIHRLQTILHLRANQMRILIYRPVLHSASSILENPPFARTVVDVAKDTIRTLAHLNSTTDIYRAQQVCFNYFLISALAVLFLASCHAPVQFSGRCKNEFYAALDLVRGFSGKSYVSKRLWRTIKGLKEVGPKLGLDIDTATGGRQEDPHNSAALAMAGLAAGNPNVGVGGQAGGHEIVGQGQQGQYSSPPVNGFVMSTEMTNLFEAALGAGTGLHGGYTPGQGQGGDEEGHGQGGGQAMQGMMQMGGGVGAGVYGNDDELYRQLRDLF